MITLQPVIPPNPAGDGVNSANAARARATGDESNDAAANGLDFAALMAGFIVDSPQRAATGVNDVDKDTNEGTSATESADAGAVDAQTAAAAPVGRDSQPASAGIGLAGQIAGAIALQAAIAPPATAAPRTGVAPQADAPGARAPGEESHAAELPGKPAAIAVDAPRPAIIASPFDAPAPGAAPASEIPALSPPATGDVQAARHPELHALQLQPRASVHALPSAAHAARLEAPLGSARWREDLAGHISVMLRDAMTQAEIRVAPPELGPILARVSVDNGVATVSLSAPAPATRDALEAALATLRERLAEGGLTLGEASVSGEHASRSEDRAQRFANHAGRDAPGGERSPPDAQATGETVRRVRLEGLVDLYA